MECPKFPVPDGSISDGFVGQSIINIKGHRRGEFRLPAAPVIGWIDVCQNWTLRLVKRQYRYNLSFIQSKEFSSPSSLYRLLEPHINLCCNLHDADGSIVVPLLWFVRRCGGGVVVAGEELKIQNISIYVVVL